MSIYSETPRRTLYRSRRERTFFGVTGGMAEYLEADPTLVRILLFFRFLFALGPFAPIVYLLLALLIPHRPA